MKILNDKEVKVDLGDGIFIYKGDIVPLYNKLIEISNNFVKEYFDSIPIWSPSIMTSNAYDSSEYDEMFADKTNSIYSNDKLIGHHCPTGCYTIYPMLQHEVQTTSKAYNTTTKSVRVEEDETHQVNFTVWETVHVGEHEYCVDSIDKGVRFFVQLMNHLGLNWKLQKATDAFFGQDAEMLKRAQRISGSKIEFLLENNPFPPIMKPPLHRSKNKVDNFIAVGSIAFPGSRMLNKFGIETEFNNEASACWGWGLERMVEILYKEGIIPEDLELFEYNDDCKSYFLNTIKNDTGWFVIDGLSAWFSERDVIDCSDDITDEYGFTIIDSLESVDKYEKEIKIGMEKFFEDLAPTWDEIWDFEKLKKRVSNGHVFLCNIMEGEVVQFTWYWFGEWTMTDHNYNFKFNFPPHTTYGGHWWCNPEYRLKRGLIKSLMNNLKPYLKSVGVERELAAVDGWNHSPMKLHKKVGFIGSDWILEEELLK
jgi:hypothetical protein